jgi:hypothetical protein
MIGRLGTGGRRAERHHSRVASRSLHLEGGVGNAMRNPPLIAAISAAQVRRILGGGFTAPSGDGGRRLEPHSSVGAFGDDVDEATFSNEVYMSQLPHRTTPLGKTGPLFDRRDRGTSCSLDTSMFSRRARLLSTFRSRDPSELAGPIVA